MAKKFNLADFLPGTGNVSNLDTMEISLIPWENIRANDANFYIVDDVGDLRNSIQMHGLLDPITVTPDEEDDRYLLISGHRRFKAWGLLRQEDPERYEKIPAMIRRFESKALSELALIMANSATRVLTPAEIGRQAERIERLFYDLKEEGYEFPGRMRDQVAAACNVSASKLARLKVIREKLFAGFMGRWEMSKLSEAQAYELAQAPEWIQERIYKVAPDATSAAIAKVREIMESGNDYSCVDLTGPGCVKCTHGDAFLRHDLDNYWNRCEGRKCCLKCDEAKRDWSPCSRMCSRAKDKRAKDTAKKKAKEEKEREKETNAHNARIREGALRLVKAADASGVGDDTLIKTRYASYTMKTVRDLASGDFSRAPSYYNPFVSEEGLDVSSAARALKCSADFLCGLTDELQPEKAEAGPKTLGPEWAGVATEDMVYDFGWYEGDPIRDGRYLCTVVWDGGAGGNGTSEQTCDWRDGRWLCYGRELDGMFTVRYWWPMPPKFEYRMLRDEIAEEDDDEDRDN